MKMFAIMLVFTAVAVLTACSSSPKEAPKKEVKDPYITLPSGLKYIDIKEGTGAEIKRGQLVKVRYSGTLQDGTNFDKGDAFEFRIGAGQVIKGWDEGVLSMRVGGIRRLVIPPGLAYGNQKVGTIPPGSTLNFEVEVLSVK